MKRKNNKKFWIGVAIGAGVSIIAMGAILFVFMINIYSEIRPQVTTDISRYEKIKEENPNIRTGLIVFPEDILEDVEETDFYYSRTESLDTIFEIYLQCTYTQEDYEKEIERLENTQKRYRTMVNTLLKNDGERFRYPAYIAMEDDYMSYEYALLTGEREITYIYLSHFSESSYEYIGLDEQYLPIYSEEKVNESEATPGYSIYRFEIDQYHVREDYTRDELAQIETVYKKKVGYNTFYVSTIYDENDNEIIKECYYYSYGGNEDYMNGNREEKVYTDLAGYQFVNLELNEEKTKAYVTYLDKGEEKVRGYLIEEKTE